ncbi:MAG: GLPGLI family protein [Flavobacteriaceae bacterium]|nr:GLPGLI family protein [Flavobacteriaceae bacterium]
MKFLPMVFGIFAQFLFGQNCLEIKFLQLAGNEFQARTLNEFKSDYQQSHYRSLEFLNIDETFEEEKKVESIGNNIVIATTSHIFQETDDNITYKNFLSDSLVDYDYMMGKSNHVNIVQKIPEINWQIQLEKDSILGFTVQKAEGKFGGRDYTAWFASDISISDGPFKLNGLPGMILKAESEDGFVSFIAQEINIFKGECAIDNPLISHAQAAVYTLKQKREEEIRNVKKNKAYMHSKTGGSYFNYDMSGGIEKPDSIE